MNRTWWETTDDRTDAVTQPSVDRDGSRVEGVVTFTLWDVAHGASLNVRVPTRVAQRLFAGLAQAFTAVGVDPLGLINPGPRPNLTHNPNLGLGSTERPAEHGELCTCGHPARVVYEAPGRDPVGACLDSTARPVEPCRFCGGDRLQCEGWSAWGVHHRCPAYTLRPTVESCGQSLPDDDGVLCGREPGHEGQHVACTATILPIVEWGDAGPGLGPVPLDAEQAPAPITAPGWRPAQPGELCTCGHQAVRVYDTPFGAVGSCGGDSQWVVPCPFCGLDAEHWNPDGSPLRCPMYTLRPTFERCAQSHPEDDGVLCGREVGHTGRHVAYVDDLLDEVPVVGWSDPECGAVLPGRPGQPDHECRMWPDHEGTHVSHRDGTEWGDADADPGPVPPGA